MFDLKVFSEGISMPDVKSVKSGTSLNKGENGGP